MSKRGPTTLLIKNPAFNKKAKLTRQQAITIPRQMPQKQNVEKKFKDTSLVNAGDASGGIFFSSLVTMLQGTTDQTRVGNKITVTNVNLRLIPNLDSLNGIQIQNGHLRVLLYVDHQANGAAVANTTDILETADITSFRNLDTVDRFTMLHDETYNLNCYSQSSTTSADGSILITIGKKLNLPIHYGANAGDITDLRSANIGILFIANQVAVNIASRGTARIKYIDM